MKKLKYLLLSFLIVSCSIKKGFLLENDYNLQKSVKSIEEIRYYPTKYSDSIIKGELSGCTLLEFDKYGNISSRKEFDSNKKLTKRFINKYDYQNLAYQEFEYKDGDSLNIYSESNYSIDSNIKISSVVHRLSNGNILFKSEFTYDSMENTIKEIEFENGQKNIIEWVNIYDGANLVERKEFLNGSDECSKTLLEYDSLGNVSNKKWINRFGETVFNDSFKYDDFGNVITKLAKNNKQTFHYEYDKHNNWTERIEYENGKPWIITERKIKY